MNISVLGLCLMLLVTGCVENSAYHAATPSAIKQEQRNRLAFNCMKAVTDANWQLVIPRGELAFACREWAKRKVP